MQEPPLFFLYTVHQQQRKQRGSGTEKIVSGIAAGRIRQQPRQRRHAQPAQSTAGLKLFQCGGILASSVSSATHMGVPTVLMVKQPSPRHMATAYTGKGDMPLKHTTPTWPSISIP